MSGFKDTVEHLGFKDTLDDLTVLEDALMQMGVTGSLLAQIAVMKQAHVTRANAEAARAADRKARLSAYRTRRFKALSHHWLTT